MATSPTSPPCNENRLNCTPDNILAATMIPSCGQLVNPSNLQAEQLIFDQSFKDLINNFGIPVDYYINTFLIQEMNLQLLYILVHLQKLLVIILTIHL